MTSHELRRASRPNVIRLARYLGIELTWETTYEGLIAAVGFATTVTNISNQEERR